MPPQSIGPGGLSCQMDTGSECDQSFKQMLALGAHMMASEKRHMIFHTEPYVEAVDSSMREFSYIWSLGGFDLENCLEDVQVDKSVGITQALPLSQPPPHQQQDRLFEANV